MKSLPKFQFQTNLSHEKCTKELMVVPFTPVPGMAVCLKNSSSFCMYYSGAQGRKGASTAQILHLRFGNTAQERTEGWKSHQDQEICHEILSPRIAKIFYLYGYQNKTRTMTTP